VSGKPSIIRLENFEKRYGTFQAVKPIDLEVTRGESFALLGPNGGGKTTIIRALVGLHRPSGGRVLVDSIDVARSPDQVKGLMSYVPQRVTMPELLTPREVLGLFARLRDVPVDRIDQVLGEFALLESADRRVAEFSGGMVQRLGLAVALLEEVAILVLDEPTVNLDPLGIEVLHGLLDRMKSNGATIVFSSHLLHHAMRMADRVGLLVEGELVRVEEVPVFQTAVMRQTAVRVVLTNTSEAIRSAARNAGAELADSNGRHLRFTAQPEHRLEVIRAIERAGATIEEFHTEVPDWDALLRGHFANGGDRS
jgi:ABC-type multidrug transport system ATPase subunit